MSAADGVMRDPSAMERYCYLLYRLTCPLCRAAFDDTRGQLRFFWGVRGREYRIGDRIRWTSLLSGLGASRVHGKPGLGRVYVFDSDDDYSIWQCTGCATEFDGPAILIEQDVITAVKLFRRAELSDLLGRDRGEHDVLWFDAAAGRWRVLAEPL